MQVPSSVLYQLKTFFLLTQWDYNMTLLAGSQLHKLIDDNVITALHENVNASSIDIRIGNEILIEDVLSPCIVDIDAKESPNFEKYIIGEEGIRIQPGQCFLAHTVEFFNLPDNISAEFVLRSTMGRCFLEHLHAGWCDAGWHGAQMTMEFKNVTQAHELLIKPGMRVGQMKFFLHETAGENSYAIKGNYNKSTGATEAFSGSGHNA